MAAALGGLDVLVFTGGVGEHAPAVRAAAVAGLPFLGVELDPAANAAADPDDGDPPGVCDVGRAGRRRPCSRGHRPRGPRDRPGRARPADVTLRRCLPDAMAGAPDGAERRRQRQFPNPAPTTRETAVRRAAAPGGAPGAPGPPPRRRRPAPATARPTGPPRSRPTSCASPPAGHPLVQPGRADPVGPEGRRHLGVRLVPRQARAAVVPAPGRRPARSGDAAADCGSTTWPTPATGSRPPPPWPTTRPGPSSWTSTGSTDPLPRGQLLVLGGDEVYPAASTEGYENRLEGPWRAALPWTPPLDPDDPAHPRLYAVPGNHDWYDGLTGFLRMFGQGRWIGGWRTRQTRSYFAVQLPAPLVAVGGRHPVRRAHRRAAARLLRVGGRRALPARRPHHPGHAGADVDPARARARRLPQPRLLREGGARPRASSTCGSRSPATCTTTPGTSRSTPADVGRGPEDHRRRRRRVPAPHPRPAEATATIAVNPDDPATVDLRAGGLALPVGAAGRACCRCSR